MNSVPVAFVERCIHRLDSNSQAETTKLSGQFGKIGVLFEENTLNLELNIQVYAGSTEIDFWAEFYGCENREAFRSDNIDWRPSLIKYSNSLDINIRMGTAPEGTPPECFVQISKFLSHFPVVHFYDAAKEIDTSHLYSKLMRCGPFCAFDLTVGTYGIQQLDYLKTLLRNGSASITFPEGELSQRDVIQVARLFLESRDTEKLIFSNNTLTSRQKFVMQNTLGLCSLWKCIDVPDGANTKEIRLTQSPELARHIFRAGTGRSANVVDRHFDDMKAFILTVFVCASCFLVAESFMGIGRDQSVAVLGTLHCHGYPASNIVVRLYDNDRFDIDDLMAETHSDYFGRFQIEGYETEITDIDPKLNIYHDCEDFSRPCQRKITIQLPDRYIAKGKVPNKMYDLGIIELSEKFEGETRSCVHK